MKLTELSLDEYVELCKAERSKDEPSDVRPTFIPTLFFLFEPAECLPELIIFDTQSDRNVTKIAPIQDLLAQEIDPIFIISELILWSVDPAHVGRLSELAPHAGAWAIDKLLSETAASRIESRFIRSDDDVAAYIGAARSGIARASAMKCLSEIENNL
jgi:hypothetical protein